MCGSCHDGLSWSESRATLRSSGRLPRTVVLVEGKLQGGTIVSKSNGPFLVGGLEGRFLQAGLGWSLTAEPCTASTTRASATDTKAARDFPYRM